MLVRELLAELQGLDPEAEVRFLHLRKIKEDGTGRVDSLQVVEVCAGDEGEVTLSDFLTEDGCLYRLRRLDWKEQPVLKAYPMEEEEDDEPFPAHAPVEESVDTLLVDPPLSREEWVEVKVQDISADGSPAGQRVLTYLQRYHDAVLGSGRATQLLHEAGLTTDPNRPLTEGLLRKLLRALLERDDGTVRHLETLMAASSFARFVNEQKSLPLGKKTLQLVEQVEALTVLLLITCVNKHFGLIR